ncbi:MAG: hypothetical protein U1E56_04120 [Bauldia sp.]
MFSLFRRYYEHVTREIFETDLSKKTFAILLERDGELAGFSSAALYEFSHRGERLRIVFSGDTVVSRDSWGSQTLARAWISEMGRISRRFGDARLFWFLIVKGHRTYRYLPTFAREFVPNWTGRELPYLAALRNALAADMFGPDFNAETGVIRFAARRGNLAPAWAEPTERERELPEVAYFLQANPGFRTGDELACLSEVRADNMHPIARRWFHAGWAGG